MTGNLSQEIKQQAQHLGFSLAGITTAEELPHADVFASWLEAGRHGEMGYLSSTHSRLCRAHPRQILPECRSILVLGMRYSAPAPLSSVHVDEKKPHGKIAAYAWGEDYHHLLPERMKQLVKFIEAKVGHAIPNRWYTDTGPLLERELAQRAGLGWIGKNTCLINPRQGSYFLLAEILLGVELEPDAPFTADRCGSCTRCMEACPTGCILPDRTLDARRCISYLTIELKGPIPPELRSKMNGWVFGCDVCQQVCPWNHFAKPENAPAFEPRLVEMEPDLLHEIELHPADFNRKFQRSPLQRARRRGYLRNVAIALGNLPVPQAVPSLARVLLSDPEPLVRAHAAWALGQFGHEAARLALEKALDTENDLQVKGEILSALGWG